MPSESENPPRVSFIMPTLNVEALLDNCLASIARQSYPRDRYEIILADAHSSDRTRDIAKKYGAIVLADDGKNMEEGKRLALQHATGEFIVFVDADNEITHEDYIEIAIKGLTANPQALGVESYYLPSPKMSSFCAYLTALLHISDPIAWLMSANPRLVARDGEIERWALPGDSLAYPLGANGFVFRRADLASVKAGEHFQDTHAALHLMRAGKREWLRARGRGVHHYYVQTLRGFVQKRRRATVHFLRVQAEAKTNWMKEKPAVPLWLAAIYCVTFIGPIYHSLRGILRDGDLRWLWHLPACLGGVLGNAWGVWTCKTRRHDKKLVAKLQVKQTLKSQERVIELPRSQAAAETPRRRIFFVSNGVFGRQPAGGDIHLLHTIRAAAQAGWQVECFGGPALQHHLKEWNLPARMILTSPPDDQELRHYSLSGQFRLLWTFFRRFAVTVKNLKQVPADAVAFSATDYWFDVLPVVFSKARLKVVVLQMQAPTLREVVFRTRVDVEATRIASLHYCLSQWISLTALRWCRTKRLVVVQPLLQAAALKKGFLPAEVACIPNGVDVETADSIPVQEKQFDVVWMGRVHRQKGIDDLMQALQFLARTFPDFRALLIGNLRPALGARVEELGLAASVEFCGYLSGAEKFRRLKSARLFLMPSRHEGLPIVVGEALACGLPVVAYELEMYRPFFGSLLNYVPCFNAGQFSSDAATLLKRLRDGESLINDEELARFKRANSWGEIERQLTDLLAATSGQSTA